MSLHVFGPDCDEFPPHVIFRDWLRSHPDDRDRYERHKREFAAKHSTLEISAWAGYVVGKRDVVVEILRKAGCVAEP